MTISPSADDVEGILQLPNERTLTFCCTIVTIPLRRHGATAHPCFQVKPRQPSHQRLTSLRLKSRSFSSRQARASSGATMLGVPATQYLLKGSTSLSESSVEDTSGLSPPPLSSSLQCRRRFLAGLTALTSSSPSIPDDIFPVNPKRSLSERARFAPS